MWGGVLSDALAAVEAGSVRCEAATTVVDEGCGGAGRRELWFIVSANGVLSRVVG